jgi:hypothetical protein
MFGREPRLCLTCRPENTGLAEVRLCEHYEHAKHAEQNIAAGDDGTGTELNSASNPADFTRDSL